MASTKIKHRKTSRGHQPHLKNVFSKVELVEKEFLRKDLPQFDPGDTVKVHVLIREGEKERIQIFEGVVIAKGNRSASKSFTIRKISHGVGVERIFLESSQKISKLEVAQEGKVRRAKLYYLRKLAGKAAKIEREIDSSDRTNLQTNAPKSR